MIWYIFYLLKNSVERNDLDIRPDPYLNQNEMWILITSFRSSLRHIFLETPVVYVEENQLIVLAERRFESFKFICKLDA